MFYVRCSKRRLKGFTLIELVISIVILIVGLVGVLLIIPLAQRASGRSALASRAAILASEKIEELKSKGYEEITSQSEWSGSNDIFTWNASITDVVEGDFQEAVSLPSEPLVKITMEVTYRDHGKQQREKFITFYSEL